MKIKRSLVVLTTVSLPFFAAPGLAFGDSVSSDSVEMTEQLLFDPLFYVASTLAAITICSVIVSTVFAAKLRTQQELICHNYTCPNNPEARQNNDGVFDYRLIETPEELRGNYSRQSNLAVQEAIHRLIERGHTETDSPVLETHETASPILKTHPYWESRAENHVGKAAQMSGGGGRTAEGERLLALTKEDLTGNTDKRGFADNKGSTGSTGVTESTGNAGSTAAAENRGIDEGAEGKGNLTNRSSNNRYIPKHQRASDTTSEEATSATHIKLVPQMKHARKANAIMPQVQATGHYVELRIDSAAPVARSGKLSEGDENKHSMILSGHLFDANVTKPLKVITSDATEQSSKPSIDIPEELECIVRKIS